MRDSDSIEGDGIGGLSDEDIRRLAARLAELMRGNDRPPRLLTIDEAAARLGCHPNTVRNLISDGALVPTYLTPRAPRIADSQIHLFVRSRTGRP